MDKDKFAVNHSPSSTWLEMQQFIGDLMVSGGSGTSNQSAKEMSQQESHRAIWNSTACESQRLKDILPASTRPLPHRKVPDKASHRHLELDSIPNSSRQSDPGGTSEETRDKRGSQVQHHTCTCPGCPYSSFPGCPSPSPPSITTLEPRGATPSQSPSDGTCHPKDLSCGSLVEEETIEPTSSSHPEPRHLHSQEDTNTADAATRSPGSSRTNALAAKGSPGSTLHPSTIHPCLCCHRCIQPCGQPLPHQHRADGHSLPHTHTHAHHHFHHHHCPLTSCLTCPSLVHSHAPSSTQSPGLFSCLSCPCSLPTCSQLLRPQPGHPKQQEEGGGTSGLSVLTTHPCMHCSASFPRPSQLLQHQRSEHAHKPAGFLCVECGRAFNSHSNLRIHLNVHTGARPYRCPDCGKSFSQSGALKIHRRIHSGEKPYNCNFCGRGFPHLAGVRAHQRTHTGERPYRCPQCGKAFTQSGALKIHTRTHTGERPFVCSLCGKAFSNRSGIRFHHRTAHGLIQESASVGRPSGGSNSWSTRQGMAAGNHGVSVSVAGESHPGPGRPSASRVPTPGTGLPGRLVSKIQPPSGGSEMPGKTYACEDCGLRFGDAPSRNRHQEQEHYANEEGADQETRRE